MLNFFKIRFALAKGSQRISKGVQSFVPSTAVVENLDDSRASLEVLHVLGSELLEIFFHELPGTFPVIPEMDVSRARSLKAKP